MKFLLSESLACAVLLCIVMLADAVSEPYKFVTVDHRDGLANSSVSSIVQDSSGFLWFGTQNGLNRYDGTSFKPYENDPFDTNSLSQNLIQTLYLDSDDVLWIGTYGGLNRFDTKTETFTVFRSDPRLPDTLSNDLIISIFRDSRGYLWVGTMKGLNVLNEKTGKFRRFFHYDTDPFSLASDTVRSICEDHSGNLWIATANGGLDRYDYATATFIHHCHDPRDPASLPSNAVMAVDTDPDGNLWVATWDYGLSRYIPEQNAFENHRIPQARAYCLNARESGVIRLGSWGGGLWEYHTSSGTLSVTRHDSNGSGSLSHDVVYSLFLDHVGDLWVGTNGGGVNRLDTQGQNYTLFKNDPDDAGSIAAGKVTSVLEDHTGTVWVGIYSGGLNRLDRTTGRFIHYRHKPSDSRSLSNDIVNYIYEDSRNTIWVLTNEGLNRYDPVHDDFVRYYSDPQRKNTLASNILYYMLEEPGTGNLWIATYTHGLDYFDLKKNEFRHYPSSVINKDSLSDPLVTSIAYDNLNRLWVGTNNGLDRMEKDGTFRHYYHVVNDRSSIPSNAVRSFFVDSKNRLWVAFSMGGISRYDVKTDSFVTYGKRNGLQGNSAISILEDLNGFFWVSTPKGLFMFDPDIGFFRSLAVQDDLRDREFSLGHFRSRSGLLYFGGTQALYCLNPETVASNNEIPPIRITSFRVFNEDRKLDRVIYLLHTIHISYKENYIGFSFTALNYRYPEKNMYAYKLEGFDRAWVMSGTGKTANYTNLPGGRYTFRVIGSNNDGVWNNTGASLDLIVSSPPWTRPWAIVLYVLAVILLMFFVATVRTRFALSRKVRELTVLKRKLESANRKLEVLSVSDGLTGIPNRRKLDEELAFMYRRAVRKQEPLAVLMLDIDYFKSYNDAYGHLAGDKCLCIIAETILSAKERSTDFAARYGGEEFAVLLPDVDEDGARAVAERIHQDVEDLRIPHRNSSVSPFVTVSIGFVSVIPDRQHDREDIMKRADEALYRAKSAGRNTVSD